ncbi:uncharacterized protein LOC119261804 [Pygocentrus nattereri]|uniref:uncharacterized protein LOC119261804 n=1 Tax=Pygocentrus nattereri TaxID=42514 RepID=UPI001890DE8F|nr:uncharacterized protein LOC119261804 [Pygocentrus nattereri]
MEETEMATTSGEIAEKTLDIVKEREEETMEEEERVEVNAAEGGGSEEEGARSVSAVGPVKVKLHDSATLSCSERCSGLARWTVFHKRSDTLAECDQTSCRSVKEGYQMIHDQYLKGNLSLIITDADFSKRGWYTCDCASKDVCDVHLQIEPLNTTVEMMSSKSLILRVDVSDAVDVIYNSTGTPGPSSGQICTVDGPSLQCKPEYTQRSSLTSGVELRRMTPSDSGVYTVMDSRNKEVIHTYTVTVQDVQQSSIWKDGYQKGNSDGYQKGSEDGYRNGLGIGAGVFGVIALALGVILGMFGGPWVRRLMGLCVQMFRGKDPSDRRRGDPSGGLQAEDVESGVALARAPQPEL